MVRVSSALFVDALDLLGGSASSPLLFLNAHPIEGFDKGSESDLIDSLVCEQNYRPTYVELDSRGYRAESALTDSPDNNNYSGALVMIDRSRDYTRHLIRRAVMSVAEDGLVLVAGEKNYGIQSVRTWLGRHADDLDSTPKRHSNLLRFTVTSSAKKVFEEMETNSDSGLFGLKGDRGSSLLASTFNSDITGSVGDFCSGTGFLGEELCRRSSPSRISFVEADYRALNYSRTHCDLPCPSDYHWLDLTCESPPDRYDWIVMNPPFHRSRAAEPELGRMIIRTARGCLSPGGTLRLVANRGLGYEGVMEELFDSVNELVVEDGFKVLEGRV